MLKKPKITSRQNTNVSKNGTFQIVEAYKNIRTGLLFALSTTKEKSIVCTSAEPGAGKSTSCSNVAITMAQTGAKVVLIDADMRKPTQHKIFRVSNSQGLSKLLSGLVPLKDSIQRDVVTNLDLIPSGPIPPNPSELLGSENMLLLLEQLSQQYDYVFVDTPPVNVVSDAFMLAKKVAGVMLAARQKQTHYDELQKAVDSIRALEANVLGVVITDVKEQNKPYGSKSYKAYDYEYGKS